MRDISRQTRLRDLVICVSLANLCCLGGWVQVQRAQQVSVDYFRKVPLTNAFFGAHVLPIFLLAVVMWVGISLVRWSGNARALKAAQCLFFIVLIVPLQIINREYLGFNQDFALRVYGKMGLILLGATVGTGPFLLTLYRNKTFLRIAVGAVLVFSPLLPVLLAYSAVNRMASPSASAFLDKPAGQLLPDHRVKGARIVWMIFDELDERLVFLERPANLKLPEFTRLAAGSLRARSAYPPSNATMISMPALITGRLISQVEAKGPDDLEILFKGESKPVRWKDSPGIFAQARKAGANAGLVGWHNPYCRAIGSSLAACSWEPNMTMTESVFEERIGVGGAISGELRTMASAVPLLPTFGALSPAHIADEESHEVRQQHLESYFRIWERALALAADPEFDLVLLHWPIPHPLGIYNRAQESFADIDNSSYVDNLALADRTLGEVRKAMEKAGLWDKSIVLVSADHPLRPYEWNYRPTWTAEDREATAGKESPLIPFLLKLPGEKRGVTFQPAFNTVLTHDLLLAALKSKITTPETAVRWLDRNRDRFPLH